MCRPHPSDIPLSEHPFQNRANKPSHFQPFSIIFPSHGHEQEQSSILGYLEMPPLSQTSHKCWGSRKPGRSFSVQSLSWHHSLHLSSPSFPGGAAGNIKASKWHSQASPLSQSSLLSAHHLCQHNLWANKSKKGFFNPEFLLQLPETLPQL